MWKIQSNRFFNKNLKMKGKKKNRRDTWEIYKMDNGNRLKKPRYKIIRKGKDENKNRQKNMEFWKKIEKGRAIARKCLGKMKEKWTKGKKQIKRKRGKNF